MRRRLEFLLHDVIAHPFCGVLWIFGFDRVGNWLHDLSLFSSNEAEEVWPTKEITT